MKLKLPKVSIFLFGRPRGMSAVLMGMVAILLLGLWACSTTNHAVLARQAYQDITSHYNAYFNCNEKLKGVFKLAETYHKDKYDSVIPVFNYTEPKEFASYSSDLDDVIKRSTLAIQIHTFSNWTDDHFLLVGECNFLKGDYDKAANSFKYITTQFKEGVDYVKVMKALGKRAGKYVPGKKIYVKPEVKVVTAENGAKTLEKVDHRPEISLWIHTPARSEALVWLIKTYTRQKRYDQAAVIVTYTRNDDLFFRDYDPDLDLAEADLKVARKDYAGAIAPLEQFLITKKARKSKKLSVRPLFVLAQCYQATGNNSKAVENYRKVLSSNPTTDMEFYAKMKMAKLARGSTNNNGEIRQLLQKMVKDNRYRDYWDQVYYELALIDLSENNRADARKFLQKSIRVSTTNDDQKAQSFLKLADLDYEEEAYVPAKYFYDSTVHFMLKSDPRYRELEERDKLLTDLVKQLTIISDEDSLQKLAGLSKAEIDQAIRDAIAKKKRDEEAKKAADLAAKNQAAASTGGAGAAGASSWYFYNATTRAAGYNDFVKKWGNRPLEDNWRRKNKESTGGGEDSTDVAASDTTKKDSALAPKGSVEEQMYAAIPTTPEKMAKSIERMVEAYYAAGTIYKDGLESYTKAREMFETLITRFPKNKLLLESYYNLYLIALKLKQNDIAEKYKKIIIDEFPESVIAKVLKDPNYINIARNKEKAVDDYLQSAYNDYTSGRLDSAWYKSQMSDVLFKPNPFSAKFQLLEALILSKQNRLMDYVQALKTISTKSTDAQVKKTATDMLDLLNKSKLPQVDLSRDTSRRDSLNALYKITGPPVINAAKPDSAELTELDKLNAAKQAAIKSGKLKVDTTQAKTTTLAKDSTGKATASASGNTHAPIDTGSIIQEDTSSPYKRSDNAIHYFILYVNDPSVTQNSMSSAYAKIDAFNSLQFADKKLQIKQSTLDKSNKLLYVRQFKNGTDAVAYYNAIKTQSQLFSDFQPGQYNIVIMSTDNYHILVDIKDIDAYNKFFHRVYPGVN
jgi:tetratricopeptide (TPR) repeat protein